MKYILSRLKQKSTWLGLAGLGITAALQDPGVQSTISSNAGNPLVAVALAACAALIHTNETPSA